jgi:hypothetical protein
LIHRAGIGRAEAMEDSTEDGNRHSFDESTITGVTRTPVGVDEEMQIGQMDYRREVCHSRRNILRVASAWRTGATD